MTSRRAKMALFISVFSAALATATFVAVMPYEHVQAASDDSSKYQECRLKCIKRHDSCSDDTKHTHNRDKRIRKATECDMQKKKCMAKCGD